MQAPSDVEGAITASQAVAERETEPDLKNSRILGAVRGTRRSSAKVHFELNEEYKFHHSKKSTIYQWLKKISR